MFAEPAQWENVIQDNKNTKVFEAWKKAINFTAMRNKLETQVKKAVKQQAKYYNVKHKLQSYKIRDIIYLNSKNIKLMQLSKKLDYKYYKLYKVEFFIGKQVCCLWLPPSIKIYNAFYVSLLELCNIWPRSALPPLLSVIVNEKEEKYEVENILDSQLHYSKL